MKNEVNGINMVRPVDGSASVQGVNPRTTIRQGSQDRNVTGVSFSKHLSERIDRRKIDLSADKLTRLNEAVDKAAGKGARDSVVLLDNLAFLVSVSNRTVLTAIETEKMKDGVFTNIDSMVVG